MSAAIRLNLLLLKTKSTPADIYEDYFSSQELIVHDETVKFSTQFIPVLQHQQNAPNLDKLTELLRTRKVRQRYDGMIFTSQRAVEAWQGVVATVEDEEHKDDNTGQHDVSATFESLSPFPIYVVGPATSLALENLIIKSAQSPKSVFRQLNPVVLGGQAGNGETLAKYILDHYNRMHSQRWFEYFEAPRLPFIPLLGMGGENYSRSRMDGDDPRLQRKPLLFLVGEIRRDIVPRTLMTEPDKQQRIQVEELEVYSTRVLQSFRDDFQKINASLPDSSIRVVVVFSPQGSEEMLQEIGYLDRTGRAIETANRSPKPRWLLVTIGPTTRNYLRTELGIEADVCASRPSPEGLKDGIEQFLRQSDPA